LCQSSSAYQERGRDVKRLLLALAVLGALVSATSASAAWDYVGTNAVASSPTTGGGFADTAGGVPDMRSA
jgi:hypothetical protein